MSTARGVLVTGASGGIGRAVAVAFAALGDRVAVHHRHNRTGAESTLDSLSGTGHCLVAGDLADPVAVQRIAEDAERQLGGVDVLVNNAGLAPSATNGHRPDQVSYVEWQERWAAMFAVNLFGAANLSQRVATAMIARGAAGRIVQIGSRGAFRGEAEHPAYAASKAALHAMGQSLALSLAPHGIAVSAVAPGFTDTERVRERLAGPGGAALREQSPFGRVGTPEEVAAAVVYLASGPGLWASGTILDCNGATHLRG